jgi:hypothetical protein
LKFDLGPGQSRKLWKCMRKHITNADGRLESWVYKFLLLGDKTPPTAAEFMARFDLGQFADAWRLDENDVSPGHMMTAFFRAQCIPSVVRSPHLTSLVSCTPR